MEELNNRVEQIRTLTYEELNRKRLQAIQDADYQTLQEIETEARERDGWDDTDPRFCYLANQCRQDISDIVTYCG